MCMNHGYPFRKTPRGLALVIVTLLAALPIDETARSDEAAAAAQMATIQVTAVVISPAPHLVARTTGEAVLIEADLPASVPRLFTLVPAGEEQWIIVLATYDGTALATYQYPLAVGSLPVPPFPGPQPQPTPAPLRSSLTKVALDAALETVSAERRADEAASLAAVMEAVLRRCEADYGGEDRITDPAALRSAMPLAAARALGEANDRWIVWAERVAAEMDRLQAAGHLADLAAYREAYRQIILGLKEVK